MMMDILHELRVEFKPFLTNVSKIVFFDRKIKRNQIKDDNILE